MSRPSTSRMLSSPVDDDDNQAGPSRQRDVKLPPTKRGSLVMHNSRAQGTRPELYDTTFVTAMTVSENDRDVDRKRLRPLLTKWRPKWNCGVQVLVYDKAIEKVAWMKSETLKPDHQSYQLLAPSALAKKLLPASDRSPGPSRKKHNEQPLSKDKNSPRRSREIAKQSERNKQAYSIDEQDMHWLAQKRLHGERIMVSNFEQAISLLEARCHENMQKAMRTGATNANTQQGHVDASSYCDVCMSELHDDVNPIIFCDGCDIGVHIGCYGIDYVPEGQWFCWPCKMLGCSGASPACILCPRRGGAMVLAEGRYLGKWAHVSCCMWVPEAKFADPLKMETVNADAVPKARFKLRCCVCDKADVGACIQCTYNKCCRAFHVSCALRAKLHMQAVPSSSSMEMTSYCNVHSKNKERTGGVFDKHAEKALSVSPRRRQTSSLSPRRPASRLGTPEPALQEAIKELSSANILSSPRKRRARIMERMLHHFERYIVDENLAHLLNEIGNACNISEQCARSILEYWFLKRVDNKNRPLIPLREHDEMLTEAREEDLLLQQSRAALYMRNQLEKLRLICDMVYKREKQKRRYCQTLCDSYELISEGITHNDKTLEKWSQRELSKLANDLGPHSIIDEYYTSFATPAQLEEMAMRMAKEISPVLNSTRDAHATSLTEPSASRALPRSPSRSPKTRSNISKQQSSKTLRLLANSAPHAVNILSKAPKSSKVTPSTSEISASKATPRLTKLVSQTMPETKLRTETLKSDRNRIRGRRKSLSAPHETVASPTRTSLWMMDGVRRDDDLYSISSDSHSTPSVVAVFSDRRVTRRHRNDDDEVISVSEQSSTSSVQALPYTKLNRDILLRAGSKRARERLDDDVEVVAVRQRRA